MTWPADPERTGFTLTGWETARPTEWPTAATTYTAQWEGNNIVVTLNAGTGGAWTSVPAGWTQVGAGDITVIERTQVAGSAVTWPADPERTGFTLTGWETARPTEWPTAATTYTAQWEGNNIVVTLNAGTGGAWTSIPAGWTQVGAGDITVIERTQVAGSAVTWPADPERTGFTLTGWNPTLPTAWPITATTYTAQWEGNNIAVTLNAGTGGAWTSVPAGWAQVGAGDITVIERTQVAGSAVTWPAAPEQTGFTLTGWNPTLPTAWPTTATTYTAQWAPVSTGVGGGGGTGNATIVDREERPPTVVGPDPGYARPPDEGYAGEPPVEKTHVTIVLLFMFALAVFVYRRAEETREQVLTHK